MDWVLTVLCVQLALAWGGVTPLVRLSSPAAVYALAGARGCMYAYVRVSLWRCPQDDDGRSFRHLHV